MVVDYVSAGAAGNTSYLNSEVSTSQDSHHDTEVIDVDAFESSHARVPIKVGLMFRSKSILKKTIYLLVVNNSFEFVTIKSNRTSFDIHCIDFSCSWYMRAFLLKESDI